MSMPRANGLGGKSPSVSVFLYEQVSEINYASRLKTARPFNHVTRVYVQHGFRLT